MSHLAAVYLKERIALEEVHAVTQLNMSSTMFLKNIRDVQLGKN